MTVDRADRLRTLRSDLRQRRRALPAAERITAAQQVARRLLALPFAPESGYVAGYWAMDGEIALHAWQLGLPAGCVYCLPVLAGERLRFAPWRPGDELVANRYGIPEPALAASSLLDAGQMSLVAVPLVGFDMTGQRLGMGGGWYDRTFAFRQKHSAPPWLAGVAFASQQVGQLDAAAWDVALDTVCTESAIHDFRATETR